MWADLEEACTRAGGAGVGGDTQTRSATELRVGVDTAVSDWSVGPFPWPPPRQANLFQSWVISEGQVSCQDSKTVERWCSTALKEPHTPPKDPAVVTCIATDGWCRGVSPFAVILIWTVEFEFFSVMAGSHSYAL